MFRKLSLLLLLALSLPLASAAQEPFTQAELGLIRNQNIPMRVLTIESAEDLGILRTPSSDLPVEALRSEGFTRLSKLMIGTVTHPSQDGVGIAGPQVGINRRVVAVQRFDKKPGPGGVFPFEIYPNIRIVWASGTMARGQEGCLSVPDKSGNVMRSCEIIIEYTDYKSEKANVVRERITGFTAVIFQHEIDHLDGILYIDRLSSADNQ